MAVENLESTSVATSKRSGEASKDVRRTCVNSIAIHSPVAKVASHPAKKSKIHLFPHHMLLGQFPLIDRKCDTGGRPVELPAFPGTLHGHLLPNAL